MSDEYGTMLRENMKRSMEKPAGFRPLNRVKRSFWAIYGDDVLLALKIVAGVAFFVAFWIGFSKAEGFFR